MRESNPRSPKPGPLRLKAAKSQSVNYTKNLSAPKDQHCSQNSVSQGDGCRSKSSTRKAPNSFVAAKESQLSRPYVDPYDSSSSQSDSITGGRTPGLSMAPTNLVRRSRYETSMRKKVVLNKNGDETVKTKEIVKTLGMEVSESQERVRASGLNLRGGDSKPSIQNDNLCDETTSSLEDDSACSSGKLSEKKSGWTWTCSTCTETESQQRDMSPPERPGKKNCGARACNQQASREIPSVWNSIQRITSKSSCHTAGRLGEGESNESQIVYQTGSGTKAEDKDVEGSHRYVSQEQASLQDRYKDEKQRKDANKFFVQESGRQAHAKSVLEISTKIIGPEQFHAEIAWIASAGSTRAPQRVSDQNDQNDESIELKLEKVYDEVPHGSHRTKTKEHGSHNRLREAVEAVWKTSLGTKGGIENQDVEKDFLETQYWDLQNEENLKVPSLREECPCEKLEKNSAQVDADDKISAYKKAWKATLGKNNMSQDNYLEKEPSDPVFWCIQRDHENLEALVAREEDLQKERKDTTTTQVPNQGRVRGATVQKSSLHEGSVEAAEGIRIQAHERQEFNSKFTEELEKGAPRTMKNPKLEAEEAEVSEARKKFQEALAKERRTNDGPQQEPRISHIPIHTGSGPGKAELKFMAESESRIAAEAKASYFEACAKAAEKRLHSLLDERNWYYKKFVEEVEYNSDMKRLQHLMELEKASQAGQGQSQRTKVDMRLLVASSVANDELDEENEDGQRALLGGVDGPGSRQSDQEELLQVDSCGDCDRLEFENWQREIEKTMGERKYSAHHLRGTTEKESSDLKKDEEIVEGVHIPKEDICTQAASFPRHEDRDTRHENMTKKNTGKKNEKKRPLSPIDSSRAQDWKPPDLTDFGKTDLCCVRDRSPFERNKSPGSPQESELEANASSECEEDFVFVSKLSDNPLYNCAESPGAASSKPLPLPAKWKKETKAELRRIMQEQELTWKMTENAMAELARRLKVLENYKTSLQDTIRRGRAMGDVDRDVDGLLSQLEKNLEDFPGGYNLLYSSPIFEKEAENGFDKSPGQEACLSPKLSQISKDYAIQLLKAEIAHLRSEISRKARSHQMKNGIKFSPLAPRPRVVSLPPVVSGHSIKLMSDFQAFVTDIDLSRLENVSEGHHSVPEVIATDTGPELPDDPFEEENYSTTKGEPRSRSNCPGKLDRHAHYDKFAPIRRVHGFNGSSWSQTPNEETGAEIVTSVENGTNSGPERKDYPESCGQESHHVEAGRNKSDEGRLQAANAFKKLSEIFWEQEAKFENLHETNEAPSKSTETRAYYLDLLKRLSQQLAELCHDLCEDTPSKQNPQVELMDKEISSTTRALDIEVEPEQNREELKPKGIMTDNNSRRATQSHEMVEVQTRGVSENLRAALHVAERKFEEELKTNSLLKEKLDCQVKEISEVMAKNAEELENKDTKLSYEKKVNMNLAHDVAQTETSLADLRSHNKELVAGLDSRLQSARSEVTSLRDIVQALKIDLEQKENLASSLEGERIKTQQKVKDLRSQLQSFQFETDAMVGEKTELERSIKQTRIDVDEQRNRIKEFISINEDLIVVAQSKENEINTLTKMVTSLQQSITEKSDEALRLLGETARLQQGVTKAREEGETYRHHHAFLRSKLLETEQELTAREVAVERLTVHLGKTIEGQQFISEEKEQLILSLHKAQSKERKLEDEVQQLKIAIQDLEEKINCMGTEMTRIKTEMEDIKTRSQNALTVERQTKELKNRVHQLEEEIMEKEGQISILTSSFP